MDYIVVSFDSTHDAMAAEKYLMPLMNVSVMPTPRSVSKACGISLRGAVCDLERLQQLLTKLPKESYGLYIITENGGAKQL